MTHQAQLTDDSQLRVVKALRLIQDLKLPELSCPPSNAELKLHAAAAELMREIAYVALCGVKHK